MRKRPLEAATMHVQQQNYQQPEKKRNLKREAKTAAKSRRLMVDTATAAAEVKIDPNDYVSDLHRRISEGTTRKC